MLINFSIELIYQTLIQMATFLVFFILIKVVFYKPINNIMEKRTEKIKNDLAEASQEKEKAKGLVAEYEQKIDNVANERYEIIKKASADADVDKDQIIQEARESANKVLENAKHEIEIQKQKAEDEIKESIVDLTIIAAEKVVGKSLDKQEHLKLINESIDMIKEV